MAPEYLVNGIFSFKSDVFSFGVIVLEILSGKRNKVFDHTDTSLNLLGYVSISSTSSMLLFFSVAQD